MQYAVSLLIESTSNLVTNIGECERSLTVVVGEVDKLSILDNIEAIRRTTDKLALSFTKWRCGNAVSIVKLN
jgi:hypothetical protein